MNDAALVDRAQAGEKAALETLITKHQEWIYNIALRMAGDPDDARDVAQEILIKIVTRLSDFQRKSSFRTWTYRIVVNHVLTMRRRLWEKFFVSFERQSDLIERLQVSDSTGGVDEQLLREKTKSGCMSGMILCLGRSQRIALILSVMQNPCRCFKKTRGAIKAGLVDPESLRFNLPYVQSVRELVAANVDLAGTALEKLRLQDVLRDRPMHASPDFKRVINVMLRRGALRQIIDYD